MRPDTGPSDIEIAKYVAGECGPAEERAMDARMVESPELHERVIRMRRVLGGDGANASADADRLWANFEARAGHTAPIGDGRPALRRGVRAAFDESRFARVASAAAFVILAGGAALWLTTRTPAAAPPIAEEPGHYRTSRGQYATIQLTDGSRVTLAPESRLTIPAAFGRGVRDVALDGEAIFSIAHDAAHPFRVHARGARVEDIGTRFDLRAYPDDRVVTVAVVEGTVALGRDRAVSIGAPRAAAEGVVLHSGDLASLDTSGQAFTHHHARVSDYVAWADGRLVFVARPLPEVLSTIGRWYDVDVRVPETALATRLVTAQFSTQAPNEMIDALAIAVDARIERKGRVVTLRAR